MSDLPVTPYWISFQASFSGLLKSHDIDVFLEFLKNLSGGGYSFDSKKAPPARACKASKKGINGA